MTQFLVYRKAWAFDGTPTMVFEAPLGTGGATTDIAIPAIVQDPVLTVTLVPVLLVAHLSYTFAQQPDLTVASDPHFTFSLTQTPTLEIYAATELLSIGEFDQDPALSYIKKDANSYSIAQAPLIDVTVDFHSGASNSTFFKTATFAQSPVLSIQHGSQTHFSLTQAPQVSSVMVVDIGGVLVTPFEINLTQQPSLGVSIDPLRVGGTHYVGGWTQVVPYPRQPTKGELRLAAKAKEKEERKRLAILAAERIKQEEAARQAEIERIRVMVDQMSMVDAAFRPQYEAQIQQLQQALMASEMEIARLRQQVAQSQTLQ